MTMKFDVSTDVKKVYEGLLTKHKKQVPFASAQALNSVAFRVQKQEKLKAKKEIDRPIPFTMRGFRVFKARKNRLEAKVFIAPIQWSYLKHIVQDSTRYPKGKFLGVPVKGNIKLNKYGNIPSKKKGLIKNDTMFIANINGIQGIWQRGRVSSKGKFGANKKTGKRQLRLIYRLKSQARYRKSFNYFHHADKVIRAWFKKDLDRELTKAIRTAK